MPRVRARVRPARLDLARLLLAQQRAAELLPHVERLLAAEPADIDYLSLKASALRLTDRGAEAIALLQQGLAAHPRHAPAWILYGNLLQERGQPQRAAEMYRRALDVQPGCPSAYVSLANVKTYRFTSAELAAMQAQLAHAQDEERIALEFALGKALEDAGEFAESFAHYARGNDLQRAATHYQPQALTAIVSSVTTLYTREFFAARAAWGSTRADPIFIVGMPRSGSTLLEQMLASHSQIEATRELADLAALAAEIERAAPAPQPPSFEQCVARLNAHQVADLARRYLARTQAYRSSGRARFIDKMPGNFCHLGLIHLLFPQAAIIDARRHPLGCGFSCFKQRFNLGHGFSYNLRELGRYYREYVGLMDHFDAVLPGRVHRLYYEHLIADPERELRRVLDYCGLPFEAQCLKFYESSRTVLTLSAEQVRRPLYAESVDHWRHYQTWLGPLRGALGDLVERYPAPPSGTGDAGRA